MACSQVLPARPISPTSAICSGLRPRRPMRRSNWKTFVCHAHAAAGTWCVETFERQCQPRATGSCATIRDTGIVDPRGLAATDPRAPVMAEPKSPAPIAVSDAAISRRAGSPAFANPACHLNADRPDPLLHSHRPCRSTPEQVQTRNPDRLLPAVRGFGPPDFYTPAASETLQISGTAALEHLDGRSRRSFSRSILVAKAHPAPFKVCRQWLLSAYRPNPLKPRAISRRRGVVRLLWSRPRQPSAPAEG
ncbi:MAG: hypothetical protein JWM75_2366 [Sphingomonas bacterium]|nr:hypothetical protein [Sphingomonas bacterium]